MFIFGFDTFYMFVKCASGDRYQAGVWIQKKNWSSAEALAGAKKPGYQRRAGLERRGEMVISPGGEASRKPVQRTFPILIVW